MTAVTGYAKRVGVALDILLNVILGGVAGQTISLRAALAMQSGNPVGCAVCAALAFLVQRNHCALQLVPGTEPTSAALRAGVLLIGLAVLLWHLPRIVAWCAILVF